MNNLKGFIKDKVSGKRARKELYDLYKYKQILEETKQNLDRKFNLVRIDYEIECTSWQYKYNRTIENIKKFENHYE